MGHARLDNLDYTMMRQIYAKGKVSIAECAEHAKKIGQGLRASEGEYNSLDDYDHPYGMVRMGFEWCVRWHMKKWTEKEEIDIVIEPILETDEQREVFAEWKEGDDSFSEEFLEILHNIKWKFAEGGRKAYMNEEIDWLTDITN